MRTATDDALDNVAEKRYRSRWGLEPRFVKEPLFKKEKEREDEEPSAASLLIASKQRLLKAAEQLAKGKVEVFLEEAENQLRAPPKLTSKLLKENAASGEKINKEEMALQISRRQLLSGEAAVASVAAKLRKATGQQERDSERKKGAELLKMVAQAAASKIEERAKQEQVMKNAGWKEWLATELGGHAAGAFGFVKLPAEWQPQTERSEEGEREESEVATKKREQEEYAKLWQIEKGEERRRHEMASSTAGLPLMRCG